MLKEDALVDKHCNSTEYLHFVYTDLGEKERGYGETCEESTRVEFK